MDIDIPLFFAELALSPLLHNQAKQLIYAPIVRYPKVTRHLSLALDVSVTYGAIEKLIKQLVKKEKIKELKDFDLIDRYEDTSLGKGNKAYTLSFTLQDDKGTLKEKRIEQIIAQLTKAFEKALKAKVRD